MLFFYYSLLYLHIYDSPVITLLTFYLLILRCSELLLSSYSTFFFMIPLFFSFTLIFFIIPITSVFISQVSFLLVHSSLLVPCLSDFIVPRISVTCVYYKSFKPDIPFLTFYSPSLTNVLLSPYLMGYDDLRAVSVLLSPCCYFLSYLISFSRIAL